MATKDMAPTRYTTILKGVPSAYTGWIRPCKAHTARTTISKDSSSAAMATKANPTPIPRWRSGHRARPRPAMSHTTTAVNTTTR